MSTVNLNNLYAWGFDDDPLKYIQVTERTRFILAILDNSMAITPKCFMGSGWLSNLAEIFCQQTFSQSLMIIQWKLFKLLSGQMLWLPPANRRMCSHNTSSFFKRAYKKQCTENVLDALKALQSLRESVVFNKHFCSFL